MQHIACGKFVSERKCRVRNSKLSLLLARANRKSAVLMARLGSHGSNGNPATLSMGTQRQR